MASNNWPTPVRFNFGNPTKLVMEFTAKSPDSRTDDIFSKCEPCNIQLYTYDWTITNYSMIKTVSDAIASPIFRVGPYENMEMKCFLWRNGDNMKIEVQLSKETKLTPEMKTKEANCPLASKISKNILDLEFLDSFGKTIDYSLSLPYEFKYMNTSKVFAWIKEENVSRFLTNDSLTIRAKLSIRYFASDDDHDDSAEVKSTKVLMSDMKNLFNDRSRFPDVVIKVGGQFILAHKSILYTHCPYFAEMAKSDANAKENFSRLNLPANITNILKENCETLCIPNEKAEIFLSVLHFIYCRQMHATESVNDFAVYEFARKYGVRELSMLMMPSEIKVRTEIRIEKLNYTWYVKDFSSLCKAGFAPIQSPNFKTAIEAEDVSWSVVIFCLDSQNIILNLQRNSGLNSDVQTSFKLSVCKADGSIHEEREFQHLFTSGTITNCHPGFMNSVSRFHITPDLLYNDTLTVCCDLVVSRGALVSELKHSYPGAYPEIDLEYWTNNFRQLLEKQNFSDATLLVDDDEFKIHKAILSARSPVFARMFESDMEEKRSGCVRIEDISSVVMTKALLYIYTGEIVDDLTMAHAPELYRTADKYEIMDLKTRCSKFIMQNMDPESASEILILADLYNDEDMKKAAKNVICRNAAQALLSPHGIELITNHQLLAHDVLESLSVVFCSLPPQDVFEKYEPPPAAMSSVPAQSLQSLFGVLPPQPRFGEPRPIARPTSLVESFKSVSLNKK